MKKTRTIASSFSKRALGALLSGVLVTGMIPALALADKLPVELGAQAAGYLSEDEISALSRVTTPLIWHARNRLFRWMMN